MEKIAGIGGFFLRARDPEALKTWYHAPPHSDAGDYDAPC